MSVHLPRPTVWPAALATGATLAAAGLVTSPLLLAFGGALVAAALVGWVRLLTDDDAHEGGDTHAGEETDAGEERHAGEEPQP